MHWQPHQQVMAFANNITMIMHRRGKLSIPVTIHIPETIHSMSGVKPPKCLSLECNKSENWTIWTQQWKKYTILFGQSDIDK